MNSGSRTNQKANSGSTGRSGSARGGRGNTAESTRRTNTGDIGQYQGTDISTGSQTPETITTPDVFDSGIANGGEIGGGGMGSNNSDNNM
jgi:hypothetical protein